MSTVANRLIVNYPSTPPNSSFRGANAIAACLALPKTVTASCSPRIPLEDTGGSGTADSHWRESIFKDELMTGYIAAAGVAMPLSRMSLGAMADLGYVTNPAAADVYNFGSSLRQSLDAIRLPEDASEMRLTETLAGPIASISHSGAVTRIERKVQ